MSEQPGVPQPSTTEAAAAVAQSRTGTDTYDAIVSRPGTAPRDPGFDIGPGVARGARVAAYERSASDPLYRPLWIYTLDPSASRFEGATAIINVPYEPLGRGPAGALFAVVCEDLGTGHEYRALDADALDVLIRSGRPPSPADPRFHQQMVYAVGASVYATFRRALGRQIAWGFDRPWLLLCPHGGHHRNAWYDPTAGTLRFGYYVADENVTGRNVPGGWVFTGLSHDIIAHEVTHALLDGLRTHLNIPTSASVLGFHEGFADVVAILQHFSYPDVVRSALATSRGSLSTLGPLAELARQFGHTTGSAHPLRTAFDVDERGDVVPRAYQPDAEAHEMGSVLVSAVFDAFLAVFRRKTRRYVRLATNGSGVLPDHDMPAELVTVLADKASRLASQFLSICIRAIDYCPPVDLELGEYLRALVTADHDLVPDDPWGYREALIEAFSRHRIYPPNVRSLAEDELRWQPPAPAIPPAPELCFARLQFRGDPGAAADEAELTRQAKEIGAIVMRHPAQFGLVDPAESRHGEELEPPCIQSVRSCRRIGPDGQIVFDLVAEVTQRRIVRDPVGEFHVYGGATVLVGPKGELRYVIAKHVRNEHRAERQRQFLRGAGRALWERGEDRRLRARSDRFRVVHEEEAGG